jgi:hypothetical protein
MTLTAAHPTARPTDAGAPAPEQALAELPHDLVAGVRLATRGGVLVATGEVPSVHAWRLVRTAMLGATAVTALADELQVRGARPLAGVERSELVARAVVPVIADSGSVAVQVDGDVTTLWGRVRTTHLRQRVLDAVRDVSSGWIQSRIDVG